jgi:hypothetical protein
MSRVERLKNEVVALTPEELAEFRERFPQFLAACHPNTID